MRAKMRQSKAGSTGMIYRKDTDHKEKTDTRIKEGKL